VHPAVNQLEAVRVPKRLKLAAIDAKMPLLVGFGHGAHNFFLS
jgi:hypothetical protein